MNYVSANIITMTGNLNISGTYDYTGFTPAIFMNAPSGTRTINTGTTSVFYLLLRTATYNAIGPVTVDGPFYAMWNVNAGSFHTNGQTIIANWGVVNAGGTLFVDGGSLTINGANGGLLSAFTVGGATAAVTVSSGTVNTTGIIMGASPFVSTFTHSGGTITTTVLTIDNTSTYTCSNSPSLTVNGTVTIISGAFTTASTGTPVINITGDLATSSGGTFSNIAGCSPTMTINGNVTNAGTLTSAGTATIGVKGNWTNNGTSTATGGTVTFNGTSAQIVSGSQALIVYNLITDNSLGITLNADLSVSGTHTFSAGIITTSVTPNYLIYAAGTSYSGDADTRHVNGWVKKAGSTDFTFPVGNGTYERTVAVENLSALSEFNVRYNAPTPNTNQLQLPVRSVGSSEYWEINKVSGGSAAIHLNWDNSKVGFPNYILADILVAYFDGSNWIDQGGTATGNALTTGNITSNSLSSFGFFAFGSKSYPLLVNFISFTAKRRDNYTNLKWVTTEEVNTDHYDIHRSDDGIAFTNLYSVPSTNRITMQEYTYKDFRAINGIAFYRIKNVDRDGSSKFSKVVTVYEDSHVKGYLRVVNPVNGYIIIYSKVEEPAARYILVNESGQQILKGVMPLHAGNVNQINFPFRPAAGTYILKINGQYINYTKKLMISN